MALLVSAPGQVQAHAGIYRFVDQDDHALTSVMRSEPIVSGLNEILKSVFWTNKGHFEDAYTRLAKTADLRPDWDTYGAEPPNETARGLAGRLLRLLEGEALPPSRLMPSAEGGIAISFLGRRGRSVIETYNTGEIAAATYSAEGNPSAWDVAAEDSAIREAIGRIRVHLSS